MSRLLYLIFSTGGAIVALLVAALWVWWRPAGRAARRVLLTVAIAYAVAGTYVVPSFVGSLLSRGYHRFRPDDVPAGAAAVVVLGAGRSRVAGAVPMASNRGRPRLQCGGRP